jgi:hypothetical protein
MIELIFALVVMGLALMSAPVLIQRTVEDAFVTYQQESIAAAATQISSVMTRAWDRLDINQTTIGEPVLNTATFTCSGSHPVGVTSSSGRYCVDQRDGSTHYGASAILTDSNYMDIDDFNNHTANLSLYNTESYRTYEGEYLDLQITIKTDVAYGDDTPHKADGSTGNYNGSTVTFADPFVYTSTTTTTIKLINVTLTSNSPIKELADKSILLGAFMCDIGAPKNFISNESSL